MSNFPDILVKTTTFCTQFSHMWPFKPQPDHTISTNWNENYYVGDLHQKNVQYSVVGHMSNVCPYKVAKFNARTERLNLRTFQNGTNYKNMEFNFKVIQLLRFVSTFANNQHFWCSQKYKYQGFEDRLIFCLRDFFQVPLTLVQILISLYGFDISTIMHSWHIFRTFLWKHPRFAGGTRWKAISRTTALVKKRFEKAKPCEMGMIASLNHGCKQRDWSNCCTKD